MLDFNATTIDSAIKYMNTRADKLRDHGYGIININQYKWGISAYFCNSEEIYQSIYVLEQYRGQGFYTKHITHTILTSHQCKVEECLKYKEIEYVIVNLEKVHD